MTLLQLTEPLFQYMCRLNRMARRSTGAKATGDTSFLALPREPATKVASAAAVKVATLDYAVVRSEIKALFEDMMSKAATDLRLSQQARKIELPLIFFVDSMIAESKLAFAAEWNQNRLAYDRQELAGDEKFFDLLDETLKENNEDAAERLAVFYICWPRLHRDLLQAAGVPAQDDADSLPRIRHLVENDQNARIALRHTRPWIRATWWSHRAAAWRL
jgi:hypothetical protein